MSSEDKGWRSLFDGGSLNGWKAIPRLPVARGPGQPEPDMSGPGYRTAAGTAGRWEARDGMIVGGQETRGYGGYLITEESFGDFEIRYEAKPDWPADTGLLVRTTDKGSQGFQILLDHRKSGAIGGFYGNGIGGFHAISFNVDVTYGEDGKPSGLCVEDPFGTLEPVTEQKRALLSYAMDAEKFIGVWRWNDWNSFTVRCTGEYPVLTSWINGVKAYELDTGKISWPGYDRDAVRKLLGRAGHIALEVHDNDPGMGDARWAPGAVCRWRNISVREL